MNKKSLIYIVLIVLLVLVGCEKKSTESAEPSFSYKGGNHDISLAANGTVDIVTFSNDELFDKSLKTMKANAGKFTRVEEKESEEDENTLVVDPATGRITRTGGENDAEVTAVVTFTPTDTEEHDILKVTITVTFK